LSTSEDVLLIFSLLKMARCEIFECNNWKKCPEHASDEDSSPTSPFLLEDYSEDSSVGGDADVWNADDEWDTDAEEPDARNLQYPQSPETSAQNHENVSAFY
jgi:hypothetical protein